MGKSYELRGEHVVTVTTADPVEYVETLDALLDDKARTTRELAALQARLDEVDAKIDLARAGGARTGAEKIAEEAEARREAGAARPRAAAGRG